ncbi:putative late blight resistance protein homolog R1B-17 [Bidens hawaiensis]|uniref:putative late blight resistance protein homolog R1B-17 n=1 Tax=Bidens hawaiensis TaxID=980011 RepID=UPI00404ACD53
MIQTLILIDKYEDLDRLIDLKKRFIDTAEKAEYIIDLFLSGVHIRNNRFRGFKRFLNPRGSFKSVVYLFLSSVHIRNTQHFLTQGDLSLSLDDVRRSFKSLVVEFTSIIKMDSSEIQSAPPAPISISTNSQASMKLLDGNLVGLDGDVELIRDKLVEDHKNVDVVSIVGMGGIGKTTLASKVYTNAYVKHHFHVRVWVTVSQTYDKRTLLFQILASNGVQEALERIGVQEVLERASDSKLREMVHKSLTDRRYLIFIDDIWGTEAWDRLKLFFPHNNNGSRIQLTSRFTEVAKHAKLCGFIHHLGSLNQERSWELLRKKVFHGNECPEWSIKPGMQIVRIVKDYHLRWLFWVEIVENTGSYIVDEENGCLETLGLSYNHLPPHLRECFLYFSGFPEDYEFKVKWLIWLWIAEGFIQDTGNRSLEDIAEGYLMDLIDKNLVIVDSRKSNGGVKACKMHDLIRELCLRKSREERFILQTDRLIVSSNVITSSYKPARKFIRTNDPGLCHPSTQNLRSILWFTYFRLLSDDIAKYFHSFVLLRVLDLQKSEISVFPYNMELLVHLRYLAIWIKSKVSHLQYAIYGTFKLSSTSRGVPVLFYRVRYQISLT